MPFESIEGSMDHSPPTISGRLFCDISIPDGDYEISIKFAHQVGERSTWTLYSNDNPIDSGVVR